MKASSEESLPSSRSLARIYYTVGALLLAIVSVDTWLSLELFRRTPTLVLALAFFYLLSWTLIVPIKGLESKNRWMRRGTGMLALSLIVFVVERDYSSWALSRQISTVLDHGVPSEFDINPTWDTSYTVDSPSFMCGQGESRELSWRSAWTGHIHILCVDIESGSASDAGVWFIHGRWLRIQQYLHIWAVVILVTVGARKFRQLRRAS